MTVAAERQCYRVSGEVTENESQPKFLNSFTVGRAILRSIRFRKLRTVDTFNI